MISFVFIGLMNIRKKKMACHTYSLHWWLLPVTVIALMCGAAGVEHLSHHPVFQNDVEEAFYRAAFHVVLISIFLIVFFFIAVSMLHTRLQKHDVPSSMPPIPPKTNMEKEKEVDVERDRTRKQKNKKILKLHQTLPELKDALKPPIDPQSTLMQWISNYGMVVMAGVMTVGFQVFLWNLMIIVEHDYQAIPLWAHASIVLFTATLSNNLISERVLQWRQLCGVFVFIACVMGFLNSDLFSDWNVFGGNYDPQHMLPTSEVIVDIGVSWLGWGVSTMGLAILDRALTTKRRETGASIGPLVFFYIVTILLILMTYILIFHELLVWSVFIIPAAWFSTFAWTIAGCMMPFIIVYYGTFIAVSIAVLGLSGFVLPTMMFHFILHPDYTLHFSASFVCLYVISWLECTQPQRSHIIDEVDVFPTNTSDDFTPSFSLEDPIEEIDIEMLMQQELNGSTEHTPSKNEVEEMYNDIKTKQAKD